MDYLRILDFSRLEFEDELTPPVPVCPSCRAPIFSVKPNALLGTILSDYYAECPEKRRLNTHNIDLTEATAICNDLLEFYTRGMIIPTREIDGLIVCMMQRVTKEQYERHKGENRGAGMIWVSHGSGSGSSSPQSDVSSQPSPDQPTNERSAHAEHHEEMSVRSNIQLPEGMASELPNGPVAGGYNPTSTEENSEGDATGARAPVTLLSTDEDRQYFVMQGFDSWLGSNRNWLLEEVWGNWQTDSDSMINIDGQRAFHLS
ncbi:hypothetical protein EV426DRAFT_664227 [Tirmania nivea]|nr:hypothetical protein EV426DRAFT_664227 [Tirmania nivea]